MRPLLLALAVLAAGCSQTLSDDPLPLGPNFLRLESWLAVSGDQQAVGGFLRWVYVADDPAVTDEPREYCELWEELSLTRSTDTACADCSDLWRGTATVEVDDETCLGVDWSERAFSLGFGPLVSAPADVAAMDEEGYTHAVYANWAPDVGDTMSFDPLFVAEPERWSSDTAPMGTSTGAVAGDYHLFCLYFWDVRESDVP